MFKPTSYLLSVCLMGVFYLHFTASQLLGDIRKNHEARQFTAQEMGKIASLYNETYFHEALSHILVPRVVGTKGHKDVREYIIKELQGLGWEVEVDRFNAQVPQFGQLVFSNVVARLNPTASRYLTLSCHYDSKYLPPRFDAATDSAVPCTIMLQIARSLHHLLANYDTTDLSLKLIFFDGEEAFKDWTAEDSLYGSRNLAAKWSTTNSYGVSVLDSIDVLVLLDLLGAKDSKLYSFFPQTQRWHYLLAKIERRLKSNGYIPAKQPLHFVEKSTISSIEDDHIPFMIRGVPILHVIPLPFPRVWHTPDDNYDILDFPTIATLNKVLQVFTLSYLDGGSSIQQPAQSSGLASTILVLASLALVVWKFRRS